MGDKKGAPANARQEAPQTTATASIPQAVGTMQARNTGRRAQKADRHTLGIGGKVYSIAIKCYEEQLPGGLQATADKIRAVDSAKYHVLAIVHDRDTVADGIWQEAAVKPHLHIILRCADRKSRVRVSTALNMLGVYFRPGVDDDLWKAHGVETVGNFTGYAMYLTHETGQAIKDAKERYEASEIISNLTPEEVGAVREGYTRVTAKHKVSADEMEALDKEAYDLGYAMKGFTEWYDSQPFCVRSNAKMKTVRESYERGVDARIEKDSAVLRLCIFIQGEKNSGKTYSTMLALKDKRCIRINGGGTGKFDKLRPDHEAIIIDDCVCPNLLNMTDNYICRAYRRGSNNPAWTGQYFVVTSNLPFEGWLEECGIKVRDSRGNHTEHYRAMESRFYTCKMFYGGKPHLSMVTRSSRGTGSEQAAREGMFRQFISRYNAAVGLYAPGSNAALQAGGMPDPNDMYSVEWDYFAEALAHAEPDE